MKPQIPRDLSVSNWQVSTNWLLGAEADFQITGERAGLGVNGGSTRTTVLGGDFNLVTVLAAANSRSSYFSGIAGTQTDVRFRDHIAGAGINYAF